jgi:hypothetical protein
MRVMTKESMATIIKPSMTTVKATEGTMTMLANPNQKIRTPLGGFIFGEITLEIAKRIGRQAGKIYLTQGEQFKNGSGYGLAHIEARHGAQIKQLGYSSTAAFVFEALRDFTEIWQPAVTRQIIAVVQQRHRKAVFLELTPSQTEDGEDLYRVNSAFPVSSTYTTGKAKKEGWEPLWSKYPVLADAFGASGFANKSSLSG